MLTVKHIDEFRRERIFAAQEVIFRADLRSKCEAGREPSEGCVEFIWPPQQHFPDRCAHVYAGTVYVMNDAGKTISKYDLGGWVIGENASAATVAAFTAGTRTTVVS
jgi:hypothetical protein